MSREMRAAIITVGSELVEGLRVDTNTAEIARALGVRGFEVSESVSVGDDVSVLSAALTRLVPDHRLLIVTGGLGPTHDDITRDGASHALSRPLLRDERLMERLQRVAARHRLMDAAHQIYTQALVLEGARVIQPTTGTAPGQIAEAGGCTVALLPGPPSEMRPMLASVLEGFPAVRAEPVQLGVVGYGESDAQLLASGALESHEGVALTVLSKPGDVQVILFDAGAGQHGLGAAAADVAAAIGDRCYSTCGRTLAEVVIAAGTDASAMIATAESCTGGMVAASLTDVAGSSATFVGSVVSYSDDVKRSVLGVPAQVLAEHGAVSEAVVRLMAEGAAERLGADVTVAVSGVAGPGGGSAEKPVGTVWYAVHDRRADREPMTHALLRSSPGSRDAIRARATATALDLMRRTLMGLELDPE